jgi:hypothetical protein
MDSNIFLFFSFASKHMNAQALEWLKKSHPDNSLAIIAATSESTTDILYKDDAVQYLQKGHIDKKFLFRASLDIMNAIRKLRIKDVFILQDQRNVLSWIGAGWIGMLSKLSGAKQIWLINHLGVVYKTSFMKLVLTNLAYFISYVPYVLFGKYIAFLIARPVRYIRSVTSSALAPDSGAEIAGWRMDFGWKDKCRESVVKMNRIISDPQSGHIQEQYYENRKCPVCGEYRWENLYVSEDGFDFARCLECGFFGASMVLNEKAFEIMRTAEPDAASESSQSLAHEQLTADSLKSDKRRFTSYIKKVENIVRPGRMLDIGCATGNSLITAQARGWHGIGIEQQEYRVKTAVERGLTVLPGGLDKLWGHPEFYWSRAVLWR